MQQFDSVIAVGYTAKGNHNNCVTKGVLFKTHNYFAYSDFKCNFNHKG